MEVRLLAEDTEFINQLSQRDGVDSAVLVSYNGDYMGGGGRSCVNKQA